MVAAKLNPGGAGPDRSVNTPTICGRKSYPPRSPRSGASGSSLSEAVPEVTAESTGPWVRPTNSPVTVSARAVNRSSRQAGLSTWLIGATTTGVLRTTTTRSSLARWINRPRSTALGACLGTVDSNTVLVELSPAAALQGTVMVSSVGTYPISGAVTLSRTPFCGQFNSAVVCLTGRNGVRIANAVPSRPAMTATRRAVR